MCFINFLKVQGKITLPETESKLAAENGWLEDELSFLGPAFFQVRAVSFPGYIRPTSCNIAGIPCLLLRPWMGHRSAGSWICTLVYWSQTKFHDMAGGALGCAIAVALGIARNTGTASSCTPNTPSPSS